MKPLAPLKRAIFRGWAALSAAAEHSPQTERWLSDAFSYAAQQERTHRSMCPGRYRVGYDYAAKAIVLHHFVQAKAKAPRSWADAAGTRRDVALAYALRDELGKSPGLVELCREASEIDYAGDIAIAEAS